MFRGCGRESGDNRVGQFVWTKQSTNQLNRNGFATVAQYRNVQQAKPPQLNDLCHHLGPVCPIWDLRVSSRKREFCATTRLVFSFFPVSMRPRLKRRPALVVQLKRVKWLVCRTAQPPWTPSCLDFPVPRDPENAFCHILLHPGNTHICKLQIFKQHQGGI